MARLNLRQSGPWVGMVGMAMLLWLYVASVLFAPLWVVVALVAAWLVQFGFAVRWFMRRPYATLLLPLLGFGIWLAVAAALR
jgi:hypothetical protein